MKRNIWLTKSKPIQIKPRPDDLMYVVRSQVHMMNMNDAIYRLWEGSSFIDVTLVCDGHKFYCHRLVLAAASPLLEDLLRVNTSNDPILILPVGMKPQIIKSLIEFMYKGETIVTESGLQELTDCAKLLRVVGLSDGSTQFQQYYFDEFGVKHELENKQTIIQRLSQISQSNNKDEHNKIPERIIIANKIDLTSAHHQKQNQINVDSINKEDNEDCRNDDEEHVGADHLRKLKTPPDNFTVTENSSNWINANLLSPNAKYITFVKNKGALRKATNYSEKESIHSMVSDQTDYESNENSSEILAMPKIKLIDSININQPSSPGRLAYIHIPKPDPLNKTYTLSTRSQIASNQTQLANPILQGPSTSIKKRPSISDIPSFHELSDDHKAEPKISKLSNQHPQSRPNSPQMPPLRIPPKRDHISLNSHAISMPPLQDFRKLAKNTESPAQINNPAATIAQKVSSFLKFNSNSMAISVKQLDRSKEEGTLNVVNMATEADPEAGAEYTENIQSQIENAEFLLKKIKTEPETMEIGETSFTEADYPKFFAMMKKEKDEQNEQNELAQTQQADIMDKPNDNCVIEPESEAENIICQPNVSYIYDDESKDIEVETGMCIDYDGLLAEMIDSNQLEESHETNESGIRKASEDSVPYYPPDRIPMRLVNSHKHKYPPTLVPLSVIHAKQFFYNQEQGAFGYNDSTLKEDRTTFKDANLSSTQRDEDPHSPSAVILRNPRCNQPRNYSTESLYNALMAVKYGESIYRASRQHEVPRKTLRNWMKRWDIKSQYPMPKQLQKAADDKKLFAK